MALDILRSAKSILKIDDLTIDNVVFKLHYRVTVAIFIGSSLVGVAKQYFGDPINCQTSSGVSSKVLDDYCWIHSTFHVRNEYQVKRMIMIPENHSDEEKIEYEGKCWLCRGPGVITRQTQIRRQLGIFPQLQLSGPEPDPGHLVLPVGPLHSHPTGGIILHTEKNLENLRGRSNRLIW